MDSAEILELIGRLDRRELMTFYLRLAVELTISAREASSYAGEKAVEKLKALNEFQHTLLGHIRDLHTDSPRSRCEVFAQRMFGYAETLGIASDLSRALRSVSAKVSIPTGKEGKC
jgi:hypothetical protein